MPDQLQTTQILKQLSKGDARGADELLPLVYDELRLLASSYMQQERADHTLQPTALVHEAFVRMVNQSEVDWKGRAHFFSVAAQMIRRVLVDHARARNTAKRGGGIDRVDLSDAHANGGSNVVDILNVDDALDQLEKLNDRHRRVVELRYFGGLSLDETAHVLGVSRETVKADWRTARAWLRMRLGEEA